MKINYTRITSPSYLENVKLRLMIVVAVAYLLFFLKTIFIADHGGYKLLYIPLCITLGYMCLKYLHEWYHYFNITAPPLITDTETYSVDVFTTYCEGEPLDMLETTLEAISMIRYPHISWCCDEADDSTVKELCGRYGIKHVTRTDKRDAKAGNINNALQYAKGDICVIIDPDHIPAPEFLDVVLPYFRGENVGFVQVVQAYYNHHESLVAKGAAQQTYLFYGPMMMSMHAYGTVQALGANCTFRRAALDSIGGHAAGLAEDMHTAMKLHAKGWNSVYVPAVVERGLVPSTLSAYYKQQLKWSRGTFELLVSVYPKLFRRFTLFQKIHYLLLPFHYLSGVIFLLNFLIPVFSLFLGQSPLLLDFSTFLLAAMPLAFMIVIIRQYVQKWVVEETERGFHMVGGLLQIGTWWIHLSGLILTLIRKKVPYIPTPKTASEPTSFFIHLPNLFIIVLSLIAIVYGLNYDLTPFSIFMAGIAFVNMCILSFVVYASYKTNRRYSNDGALMRTKRQLWYLRHWTYKFARNYALTLSFLIIACSFFAHKVYNSEKALLTGLQPVEMPFYKGVFQSASNNGLSATNEILNKDIQITSYYIKWTDTSKEISLPLADFNKLFQKHIVPLIMLQPKFGHKSASDQIVSGKCDSTIHAIAKQLSKINGPVFLSLIQWSEDSSSHSSFQSVDSPETSIAAWQYLHKKFEEAGLKKIAWVWNLGNADSAERFFPGLSYVDWLGVTVLDYARKDSSISFEDLYRPFHKDSIFKLGLPVMITEAGTRSSQKQRWWNNAWNGVKKRFPEINAVVMFNDSFEKSETEEYQQTKLSWKWDFDSAFYAAPSSTVFNENDFENFSLQHSVFASETLLPENMRSVVYDKGVHWFRNSQTGNIKTLQEDIQQMATLGVNTIFRTIPDIYSKNFFRVAQKNNLNVVLQLWVDIPVSKLADDEYLEDEQERLVGLIRDYKGKKNLIAWNLSNDVLHSIETSITKPDRFYRQGKYLLWLQQLITKIRKVDNAHPVFVSVIWNDHAYERINLYKNFVESANQFLLNVEKGGAKELPLQLPPKFSWGFINPALWNIVQGKNIIVPAWQDQATSGFVSLNGIIDLKGRKKQTFEQVIKKWKGYSKDGDFPAVKILMPAKIPSEGQTLKYHALLKNHSGVWNFASDGKSIRFEWYLIRTDIFGNPLSIKIVGNEAALSLRVPSHPELCQLYLEAVSKEGVTTIKTRLGIPLDVDSVK